MASHTPPWEPLSELWSPPLLHDKGRHPEVCGCASLVIATGTDGRTCNECSLTLLPHLSW
jgi:hypothetical protein